MNDYSELSSLIKKLLKYKQTNKLEFFEPYPYQVKFANAGKHYKQRFLRAANRVGKSYGTAAEFAMHLTGRYQPWFDGERIPNGGHTYWCVGIDLSSVAKVMQKELLGTNDIRVVQKIGTGMIPLDHIVMEPMVKNGGNVQICSIKHVDGTLNTLMFYGSNNEATMMGDTVMGIWLDEEPEHNSEKIYAQCLTRTMTTNGFIMMTATPEKGQTKLNDMFDDAQKPDGKGYGEMYIQQATWWDAPHITPEMMAKMSAGIPSWQLDMRSKGLPVLGTGAIFPVAEDAIREAPVKPEAHWPIVCSVDFGETTDASVVSFTTMDDDNVVHLIKQYYLDKSVEQRTPRYMAKVILESDYPHCLVVVPHDGGLASDDPEAKAKLLIEYGCNVHMTSFRNPSDVKLDDMTERRGTTHNSIHAGLIEMRRRMEEGTYKVSEECTDFFAEMRTYFWKEDKNNPGKRKPTGRDHAIDAARYGIMSLLGYVSCTVDEAIHGDNTNWSDFTARLSI